MDQHAFMMEKVGAGILQAAAAEERALDAQLAKMDNIDEDTFEALRQKRKLDLQKKMRTSEALSLRLSHRHCRCFSSSYSLYHHHYHYHYLYSLFHSLHLTLHQPRHLILLRNHLFLSSILLVSCLSNKDKSITKVRGVVE